MLALIDGDIIVYRIGWVSEKLSERIALARARETVEGILRDVGATEYQIWLSDSLVNNFRYQIDPLYKANRKDTPKPIHYQALKDFLIAEWNAQITAGQEADDELGIQQCAALEVGQESIISGIDKDLLMIPGKHHNWVKRTVEEVTHFGGIKRFYKQMLIGDTVDNIFGIKGIGPVKAGQAIDRLESEIDCYDTVVRFYGPSEQGRLRRNANLLWIRRKPGDIWSPPESSDQLHLSSASDAVDTNQIIESELQDEEGQSGDSVD